VAQIEISLGPKELGRSDLNAVKRDALEKGFRLIAQKASREGSVTL
jgi:hypothetical protein